MNEDATQMENERQAFSLNMVHVSARWLIFMSSVALFLCVWMEITTIASAFTTNSPYYGKTYWARRGSMVDNVPLINLAVRRTLTNSWSKALVFCGVEWLLYTLLNSTVLIGALRMRKFRSYRLANVACILSCVPCVIAMWPLGALGGALGLVFLGRADVKRRFVTGLHERLSATEAHS